MPMIEKNDNLLKKKVKRPSADDKRKRIIGAARQEFVKNGFSGTSMAMIAKAAKVPKSLLFHHFENKQILWQLVKENIVQTTVTKDCQFNVKPNLVDFLKQIIELRFQIYTENPDVIRLIAWQMLEVDQSKLISNDIPAVSPTTWLPTITNLQKQNEIRSDMSPAMVMVFIASSVAAIFLQDYDTQLKTLVTRNKYKRKILDCLLKALKS